QYAKKLPVAEAPIYIEIDKQSDPSTLQKIHDKLCLVLEDVDLMVRDWTKMLDLLTACIATLESTPDQAHKDQLRETIAFLRWLAEDHFTFIGCAEYTFKIDEQQHHIMEYVPGSALGVLANPTVGTLTRDMDKMYPEARAALLGNDELLLGKTDTQSTVHRPAYTDFVGIKIFNAKGQLEKMVRFVGLYTSIVYNESVDEIPYVRKKIARVFEMTSFPKTSHDGRALMHILDTLPRDELFQARDSELFDFAIGILHLQERQKIKLFIRRDVYGRYFSCLVYVPRELFTAALRNKMQEILVHALDGQSVTYETQFSESILARIHFIIRVDQQKQITYDPELIEEHLIEASRTWEDTLLDALDEQYGEEQANTLFKLYANAFPLSYKEIFGAHTAVQDIAHMEILRTESDHDLEMTMYRPIEDSVDSLRFKLFRYNKSIPLSDVVPILEKMGLRIISERPHEIEFADHNKIWITDYRMIQPNGESLNPEQIKESFQEAFAAVWAGETENDRFNRMVLSAQMQWRDISILRSYYRYLWQTGFAFSQSYVEDAIFNNSALGAKLLEYFYAKFNPVVHVTDREGKLAEIKKFIVDGLDAVSSLNEDRIIRAYLGAMEATIRTNFFQQDERGWHKKYISLKFDSSKVPDLPLPRPVYEVFVYSSFMEAIHLRGDKIARGGIRWSDRIEDFRTEVLGLMKAQQVKNAVIVPLGAKGGFVVKTDLLTVASREEKNKIVINCYKTFIRGLLDVTDNYQGHKVLKPANVICWDKDDPYLVVAADKGTASFSDIANGISKEYNFWLGDAFASGGSSGYDHKKMGITARGAWESVKLHFIVLGMDIQQPFTVIGIGDLAGDVFGNGMLQSDKIKLVAAFNHVHIFVDPNPDPVASYNERLRMFNLPTSSWTDYNPELISTGGGVFERSAKKVPISAQMKTLFNTEQDFMEPNDLVRAILMLNVDLFYNGGIGTFVKASSERHTDVGDRANDAIRINGNQINARIVCEGGNLGFTQLARIEYALKGGVINTDAIDNSGGVNCSDNEVNLKILLNDMIAAGDLTEKQRNEILVSMTDNVATQVLANNRKQNCALILAAYQAPEYIQMHFRLLKDLVRDAGLDPAVEYLPDGEEITLRVTNKQGFTRPELAVLMAYTKNLFKKELLQSTLLDEEYMLRDLIYYFPKVLQTDKYLSFIKTHRLKKAIIATRISNYIVNEMGINFVQRLSEESGTTSQDIARAYMIARDVFDVKKMLHDIWKLGGTVSVDTQLQMWQDLNRLIRRTTRWFVRNLPLDSDIKESIQKYKPYILQIQKNVNQIVSDEWLEQTEKEKQKLLEAGVPKELAQHAASFSTMYAALDIIEATTQNNFDVQEVAKVYFTIGTRLQLGWFGELIKKQPVRNYWEALARAAFRDDVDKEQRDLTISILSNTKDIASNLNERIEKWLSTHKTLVSRWEFFLSEFKTSEPEFTMFAIALRELVELASRYDAIYDGAEKGGK
ncbi:MAG TPA: NAD-glutamate dehydrogenase, partial [Gammaproteobacteria bacterium]|nr:NAD-glutamate dehydrogenase [Gammaproteobacteria bacterium]